MTTRTPATPDETLAVRCLQRCGLPVASWDKRFVRQLHETELSEKERPQVWRLFKKYRRQIHGQTINGISMRGAPYQNLLATAEKLAAPDLRALNAKHEIQQRIAELKKPQIHTDGHRYETANQETKTQSPPSCGIQTADRQPDVTGGNLTLALGTE